jgi:hypothetical protein
MIPIAITSPFGWPAACPGWAEADGSPVVVGVFCTFGLAANTAGVAVKEGVAEGRSLAVAVKLGSSVGLARAASGVVIA